MDALTQPHTSANMSLCGVTHNCKPWPHYSGNFWWFHSDYMKTLNREVPPGYFAPEAWVDTKSIHNPKWAEVAVSHYTVNGYKYRCPISNYSHDLHLSSRIPEESFFQYDPLRAHGEVTLFVSSEHKSSDGAKVHLTIACGGGSTTKGNASQHGHLRYSGRLAVLSVDGFSGKKCLSVPFVVVT